MRQHVFGRDFKELLMALQRAEVRYILVGGYAVIVHGYQRSTGDLDIWLDSTEDNYNRLMIAFADFGLPSGALKKDLFLDHQQMDVFTFGRSPVAIEFMTSVKGLTFREAMENASLKMVDGIEVNTISLPDLIKAKESSGRYRDLDDIEKLRQL